MQKTQRELYEQATIVQQATETLATIDAARAALTGLLHATLESSFDTATAVATRDLRFALNAEHDRFFAMRRAAMEAIAQAGRREAE